MNYVVLGCIDLIRDQIFIMIFFCVFIYAQTILYDNPIAEIFKWNVPMYLVLVICIVLFQMVIGKFYQMKAMEIHLETGHELFCDELEEGMIIHPHGSN